MSEKKKDDLTRIEDLGEYLHDFSNDEFSTEELDSSLDTLSEESGFAENSSVSDQKPDFEASDDSNSFQLDETSDEGGTSEFPFESENLTSDSNDTFPEDFELNSEELSLDNENSIQDLENDLEEATLDPIDDYPLLTETTESEAPQKTHTHENHEQYENKFIEHPYKTPENFEDLKKFAESTNYTGMGVEGNPSFSVLLKNVRYIEDVNDILIMLKDLNLLSDSEDSIRKRLMRGHLLIPRISEYAAIYLAHKLRRFDIDIQVGLSDEIHPPKHQETPETGVVSKHNLYQNQSHHFHFDDPKLELSQIIVAATPTLEGHQVIRYLGVASEHKMLEGYIVEDEGSLEVPLHYSELAQKLKAHALKANANAVIGLNYQLTPLPSEYGMSGSKYRLSCTGNLVWVSKL